MNNTKSELHLEIQTPIQLNLLDNSDFTNPINQKIRAVIVVPDIL